MSGTAYSAGGSGVEALLESALEFIGLIPQETTSPMAQRILPVDVEQLQIPNA